MKHDCTTPGTGPCPRVPRSRRHRHAFVFHAPPQTFDEHIVPPCAAAVHGEVAAAVEHGPGELLSRELAALIGVDDIGQPKARKGLLGNLPGVARLDSYGDLVRQHHAASLIRSGDG